jgi:Major Facilitator Superfamily
VNSVGRDQSGAAPEARTGPIYLYFAPLTLLIYLGAPSGYLLDICTTLVLKDHLHASATDVSVFRFVTALPLYLSFLFGLTRDTLNPLGMRDRGYLLLSAPAAALVFAWMTESALSYLELYTGILLTMVAFRFIAASYLGLIALVGQEKLMSGRLAALWNTVAIIPYIGGAFVSGWMAEYLSPSRIFLLAAVLSIMIAVLALWKPPAVFAGVYNKPAARGADLWADVKRLLRHKAIYPAVLILMLYSFAPGSNTPLQFYLINKLHASDAEWGYFNAIQLASFLPMYLLYGWLCKRVALKKLLWWSTAMTVPQYFLLAFIHSSSGALALAPSIGLLGGMAGVAYYDLAMRSCPPGLQGSLMMIVEALNALVLRGSDIVGTKIYGVSPKQGFLYCVIAVTLVYAAILPVLRFVPRDLIATADGEPNPLDALPVKVMPGGGSSKTSVA